MDFGVIWECVKVKVMGLAELVQVVNVNGEAQMLESWSEALDMGM